MSATIFLYIFFFILFGFIIWFIISAHKQDKKFKAWRKNDLKVGIEADLYRGREFPPYAVVVESINGDLIEIKATVKASQLYPKEK